MPFRVNAGAEFSALSIARERAGEQWGNGKWQIANGKLRGGRENRPRTHGRSGAASFTSVKIGRELTAGPQTGARIIRGAFSKHSIVHLEPKVQNDLCHLKQYH